MNPQLVSILQHLHLYERGKAWRDTLDLARRVMICRWNRRKVLHRIRHREKGEKIRVLFLVSEVAKWKCQTVFEAMKKSGVFEPVIALTALSEQARYSDNEMALELEKNEVYFDRLEDAHIRAIRLHPREYLDMRMFKADVVFFQEPWRMQEPQTTEIVSQNALVCYVPYDLPTWNLTPQDFDLPFHKFLCFYYVLNEAIGQWFESNISPAMNASCFVPVGHPAFDRLATKYLPSQDDSTIIYAPHWTVNISEQEENSFQSGTFSWSGHCILEYAKAHPEFKWVFKPHPKLKKELIETGLMNPKDVERYYKAWEKIGQVCWDGEYQSWFAQSRAMITDSGTFLLEYGVLKKPIIHLKNRKFDYGKFFGKLYATYYAVYGKKELEQVLSSVLENKEDPFSKQREEIVNLLGLEEEAGNRIVAHLSSVCRKRARGSWRKCMSPEKHARSTKRE